MNKSKLSMALLLALCGLKPALAAPVLLAIGTLNGNGGDLSAATAGPLENGTSGNLLGGLGSGLAWAGGNTFVATPDRGPNATGWNAALDNTTSYLSRFQTLGLGLVKNNSGTGLGWSLTPTLTATTLMYSATPLAYAAGATPSLNGNGQYYFSGRSDNFDPAQPSTNPNNARLDPEGVRVSKDGKSIFVSDEYGPYVYQIDRATGRRIRSFALPANLAVTHLSAQGDIEISGNTVGRVANKGMEGLAITPDGKTLVGIMQAPLEQDAAKNLRIVTIDIASGTTHEYAYRLTTGSGVSEIVALNDHQFLVDERDGKGLGDGSKAAVKQFFKIDLNGAQDVTALSGDLSAKAVAKSLVLDVVAVLGANGIAPAQVPAKIEGLAFGADVVDNGVLMHTLYVANDNDFVPASAGDNKFYVFGISDADLSKVGATFTAQQIQADVPEPSSIALVVAGLGMLAVGVRRRT
ncbi:esterase-like activity of phytase family protein [Massilia putida]|uniref:esterase-like activity of phytase family protein n=1 Tax=Massilia putida TaxID=1141883 RepID=UPI000951900A|nr:esterase-like activity of phytase family protein [Massilia putida]